jgi:hypothetical protein
MMNGDALDQLVREAMGRPVDPGSARRVVRASLRVEAERERHRRARRRVAGVAFAAVSIGFALLLLLDRDHQQVAVRQRPPKVNANADHVETAPSLPLRAQGCQTAG